MSIKIGETAAALRSAMDNYSEAVLCATSEAVAVLSEEAVKTLTEKSPRRSGSYAKDWTNAQTYKSARTRRNTVYNRSNYRLTHLLEHGHALKRGGRTGGRTIGKVAPSEHIAPVEEYVKKELERRIVEAVENGVDV